MNQIVQIQSCQYTPEQNQLLKDTVCKGASDNDFMIFSHICKRTGLDPFAKQIYAVMRWDKKLNRNAMTIQTGIDGYRVIAERTGRYAPGKEPTYAYDGNGKLISATAYAKKQTQDGTWHEVSATAFYSEYVQVFNGIPTQFWSKMPHGQLAKCAEALALRKAFPQEMSGVYTKEEMDQASNEIIESDGQVIDDNVKQIAPNCAKKVITQEQLEEITRIVSQCSTPFKEEVKAYLSKCKIGIFSMLSEPQFNNIMLKAIPEMEAYQASLKEAVA